ncbi:MAG: ATP-binding cassette domain-containing protein [Actinomycetota bacterium]|jgi:daunorubicin resistance ABC transporter ATP-binding subunit|nr:ATP-binding cassette domain-containing protein [Actinomycetota bacterium]
MTDTAMTDAAIVLDHVAKSFGDVKALDGLDLAVAPGTVYGLLGPNGAGKTTAVKVLATLTRPDAGHARVLGLDVVEQAEEVRSLIGLAGQYAAVDENLTGRENLRLIGRLTHLSRTAITQRADELLERFDLTDAGHRPTRTYSGGMRRRLDLAAALVHRPPVLFLDEPTTGLDPHSRRELWSIIEELVGGGTTLLLTTQYLEEADRLAERIAVVDGGRVIAEGTPAELKSQMSTTVLELSFHEPESASRAAEVVAGLAAAPVLVEGTNLEVPVDDGPQSLIEALRAIDRAGLALASVALREPSLDDVFLALTGRRATPAQARADGADGARPDGQSPTESVLSARSNR